VVGKEDTGSHSPIFSTPTWVKLQSVSDLADLAFILLAESRDQRTENIRPGHRT
jgi:hypothetical protein